MNHTPSIPHQSKTKLRPDLSDRQSGAVLLTTLLIMALMAVLAVAIFQAIGASVKRTMSVQAAAQIHWLQKGARDYTDQYLEDMINKHSAIKIGQILQKSKPLIFPIDGGVIQIRARDDSQCFSLGSLVLEGGQGNGDAQDKMATYLSLLGLDDNLSQQLAAQARDWADIDQSIEPNGAEDLRYLSQGVPQKTAGRNFISVSELRALPIMNEKIYQHISKRFCVGEAAIPMVININAVDPNNSDLLTALIVTVKTLAEKIEKLNQIETAIKLALKDRPVTGYQSVDTFWGHTAWSEIQVGETMKNTITIEPQTVLVETNISFGDYEKHSQLRYRLDFSDKKVTLIHRAIIPDWADGGITKKRSFSNGELETQ